MELRIQAIHFDASEKLVSFINKKVNKLTRRCADATGIDVTLKVIKPETSLNKEAIMQVKVPQEDIIATKTADTFEEAIDLCIEAIERQLEKVKEKK